MKLKNRRLFIELLLCLLGLIAVTALYICDPMMLI